MSVVLPYSFDQQYRIRWWLDAATTFRSRPLGVGRASSVPSRTFCTGKKQCHQSPSVAWPFLCMYDIACIFYNLSLCLSRQIVDLHVSPCGVSEAKTPKDPLNARVPDICGGLCHSTIYFRNHRSRPHESVTTIFPRYPDTW